MKSLPHGHQIEKNLLNGNFSESSHWTTSPLILKMPMKTGERAMLLTLVLQKQRALVHVKFFEILFQELLFIEGGSAVETVFVIIGTVWGHFYHPVCQLVVTMLFVNFSFKNSLSIFCLSVRRVRTCGHVDGKG